MNTSSSSENVIVDVAYSMDTTTGVNIEMDDRIVIQDLPDGYEYEENGFVKQVNHIDFPYDEKYKEKQSTNAEMTFLRLGWLSAYVSCDDIMSMKVVDIGCGNGEFIKHSSRVFDNIHGFDLAGESISTEELEETVWDLVVLSDVLEHFDNIDYLFTRLKWKFCLLSYPETPEVETFEELSSWRHFKPNEHIYYLHESGVKQWVAKHDAMVVGCGDPEDMIRKRWHEDKRNITTMLILRECCW